MNRRGLLMKMAQIPRKARLFYLKLSHLNELSKTIYSPPRVVQETKQHNTNWLMHVGWLYISTLTAPELLN